MASSSSSSSSSKHKRSSTSAPDSVELHATSKWQEPRRVDELTLWEVHRKPRKLVDRNRRIRCPLELLNRQFRCAICLGYLKETTIVMECLHRFCGECINKCIRLGMKECPSCRKSIPSRRSLRRDIKFDQFVNHMVGSPAQREIDEDQSGKQEVTKMAHLQKAISKKKRIVERQKQRQKPSSNKQQKHGFLKPVQFEKSPLLELELRRHPRENRVDRLKRGFLQLRGDAKVSVLKTFLSKKLENHGYDISAKLDDVSVILQDDITLKDAKRYLCGDTNETMVLNYRVSAKDTSASEESEGKAALELVSETIEETSTDGVEGEVALQEQEGFSKQNAEMVKDIPTGFDERIPDVFLELKTKKGSVAKATES